MGFDPIQHALCEDNTKQEIKRQRLFGVDEHVFTYNGDKAGKTYFEFMGATCIRVGPAIDPETVTEISAFVLDGANIVEAVIPKSDITIDKNALDELGVDGTVFMAHNFWIAFVIHKSTDSVVSGTYAIDNCDGKPADTSDIVTSRIKSETIHPIDPRFLPGACLPVVEITSTVYPESGAVALSAEEGAQLRAAADAGMPAVIKIRYIEAANKLCLLSHYAGSDDDGASYIASVFNQTYVFSGIGTDWMMGEEI